MSSFLGGINDEEVFAVNFTVIFWLPFSEDSLQAQQIYSVRSQIVLDTLCGTDITHFIPQIA